MLQSMYLSEAAEDCLKDGCYHGVVSPGRVQLLAGSAHALDNFRKPGPIVYKLASYNGSLGEAMLCDRDMFCCA